MKEVVRKEVTKWLDVGIVYPISDSKWISLGAMCFQKGRYVSGKEPKK